MAIFVDLGEEDSDSQGSAQPLDAVKPVPVTAAGISLPGDSDFGSPKHAAGNRHEEAHGLAVRENPNRNSMAKALGCYPIVMALASSIDLNTLDSLSRTCRQIRQGLLQYRKMLLVSTLHCVNEDIPVDPELTLRYRARAGNWFYMQDAGRSSYNGKSGQCARDLVAGCRRCGTVVCRNCAIKPPAPIVLRDRHRRLCGACVTAPLGSLVKPRFGPEVRIDSDDMQRAICTCDSEGVWLCQPCGRSIRGDDSEYKGIWRWRNQYTELHSGLGTGIGEGDRGVICGRESECCAAREREQEIDGDAEDAREAEYYSLFNQATATPTTSNGTSNTTSAAASSTSLLPWTATTVSGPVNGSTASLNSSNSHISSSASLAAPIASALPGLSLLDRRTPSPALKPGYERHEVEGIGGVVKKMRIRTVRVGACVPEWEDERAKGDILGRELQGKRRSWCGWCRRVVPSRGDYEGDRRVDNDGKGKEKEGNEENERDVKGNEKR